MFASVAESPFDFVETIVRVRKAVETQGWSILGGYDFSEVLASKGFAQQGRIKTLDICHAGHANAMLAKDLRVALCMPCTVAIFEEDSHVKVGVMLPGGVLPGLFTDRAEEFKAYLGKVDEALHQILNGAIA